MRLCLRCAQVGQHEVGCPDDTDAAADARTKSARVGSGLTLVKAILSEAEGWGATAPREALRLAWVAERMLERYPATDFATFDARRSRNDVANAVAKVRERAAERLGDAEAAGFLEDMEFGRRALELFAEVARRRHEAVSFDLSEFVQLPPSDRREVGEALKELCQEVEKSLSASTGLEEVVAAWGPENVAALAAGTDPVAIPPDRLPPLRGRKTLLSGIVLAVLGLAVVGTAWTPVPDALGVPPRFAWAGVGLALVGLLVARAGGGLLRESGKRRRAAPLEQAAAFRDLSVQYRQRVYMSAALRILRRKATLVEKAEDAFRKFTGGNSAARWKRLYSPEGKDVVRMFFDWDDRRPLKDAVSLAVAQAIGPKERLRPFDEMATDGWEVLLKAFLLDIFAGDEARFFDGLALLIVEGGLPDDELHSRAMRLSPPEATDPDPVRLDAAARSPSAIERSLAELSPPISRPEPPPPPRSEVQPRPTASLPREATRETVINADASFKGDFSSEGAMRIEGKVEGKINAKGKLTVGKGAQVTGEAVVAQAVVEGALKGNITASERVELAPSARVTGDIRAPRLVVGEGAVLQGNVAIGIEASAMASLSADRRKGDHSA
ncbi:polymer-forming cytoskeletal protein [bacterium]|nr:polymer-forming cytoskeletal protein [bacterium]